MSVWWQQLVLVMCGGAVGAAGRFWLGGVLLRRLGDGFPWGTLAANLGGAFLAGFIAVWLHGRGPMALYWRAFLIVGVLGGLTTYSALMLESPYGIFTVRLSSRSMGLPRLTIFIIGQTAELSQKPLPR